MTMATIKTSGAKEFVRIVGDSFQLVTKTTHGEWEYDSNWYPLSALEKLEAEK